MLYRKGTIIPEYEEVEQLSRENAAENVGHKISQKFFG